ncbi:hypothetical protein EVG20_g4687 [Dentipellis fragilis]|uniref:ATP synthase subunit H, mitochondrial n=1 Tax=Dentipellis fragilis TaxID=205917 RepID=A0A4Y9YXN9_9AGAM|nr:hypothetical protein EVG20_g4687 [Dentipellis fragilis]
MSAVLRNAAAAVRAASRTRAFATSAVARKDLVQDLYIKELKSYKPTPPAKDAHVGAVKPYSLPAAPHLPLLPADLASELSAYDVAEPTLAAAESAAAKVAVGNAGAGAEAYLAFLEADEAKEEAHH